MDISESNADDSFWSNCICLIEKTFVPRKLIGESRPCLKEDFQDYKAVVDQYLQDILSILQHISYERKEVSTSLDSPIAKIFKSNLLILIGEHCQINSWTTTESVNGSKKLAQIICNLYSCDNLHQLLKQDDDAITRVLCTLRPKLLKETWKTYPAAVSCYKWFLSLMGNSGIIHHLGDIIPTALIILDDFVIDNQILGLECLLLILQHCFMEKKFVELGFAKMVLVNLQKFTYEKDSKYTLLLYNCITKVLNAIESCNNNSNLFKWNERDNIVEKLLDYMECEENLQLRQSYMTILPELLNSPSSFKWFERVICILKGYCEHYGDLNTLKITLESTKSILLRFQFRIPAHCKVLHTIFLKLYLDLSEDEINKDLIKLLEDCIYSVCKMSPEFSKAIMHDDRIRRLIVKHSSSDFVNRLFEAGVYI